MSNYQLIYQDRTYKFASMAAAQQFIDEVPSRGGVEIGLC